MALAAAERAARHWRRRIDPNRQNHLARIDAAIADLADARAVPAGHRRRDLLDFAAGWSQPAPLGERYEHEITK